MSQTRDDRKDVDHRPGVDADAGDRLSVIGCVQSDRESHGPEHGHIRMRVANGDAGGQVNAPAAAVLNDKVPLVVLVEVPSHLAGETTIRTFFDLSTRHCVEAVPLLEALRRESPGDCTE